MMAFSKTRNWGPEDVPLLEMNQLEALIQIFVSPSNLGLSPRDHHCHS